MHFSWLTVVVIAVASNLDNAGVGIAYGVRGIRISWLANLVISLLSGVMTYAAGLAGHVLSRYLPVRVAAAIGGGIIILVGMWILLEPIRSHRVKNGGHTMVTQILRDPVKADLDKSQTISLREALILGVALALNAIAGGFDAGISQIGVLTTAVAVAIAGFLLLAVSAWVGRRFAAQYLGGYAAYLAAILLVAVGIHQIW
ncbi:manganese efflux pump [Alicyclobacillus herbarius]|uniref:manganese efflux pump n=1 Tax=Alicyclobacillus herbarius TaxID=122960 RepID=UPI00047B90A9|nr:manganese efflux pump [Alicyclobacillus herbarius]